MRFLLPILLAVFLVLTGCGAVEIHGGINFGHISGTVSIVSIVITDTQSVITVVTLTQAGSATTMNFCGDQRSQFPVNNFVRADFNSGSVCNTVVTVSIG